MKLPIIILATTLVVGPAAISRAQEEEKDVVRDRTGAGGEGGPKLVLETHGFTTVIKSLDFSADGRQLVVAGRDKAVRIWDLTTGQLRATLRGEDGLGNLGTPMALAFSPSGRELLVGITNLGPPGAIRVYHTADLGRIAEMLPGHVQGGVSDLAFTRDGKYLASAGQDGVIILWDWPARRPIHQLKYQPPIHYLGFPIEVPILATIDGTGTHMYTAGSGRDLTALADPREFQKLSPRAIQELAEELGGSATVGALANRLMPTMKALAAAKAPFGGTNLKMRFYLETAQAVCAGLGKKEGRDHYYVTLYTVAQQNLGSRIYEGHTYIPTALALSPDRTLVASGDYLGEVHVWEARTGRRRFRFSGAGRPIYRVGFDSTGRTLALGTRAHSGARWQYNDYADPDQSFDLERRRLVDLVPDSLRTEVMRQGDRELRIVEENGRRSIQCFRQGTLECRFTPEGMPSCSTFLHSSRAGFADPVVFGDLHGVLDCMDPQSKMIRRHFYGHQGAVMSLSESPDGRFLASSSIDRTVRLWSLEAFRDQGLAGLGHDPDGTITLVVPDGPAARAGVRRGDKLLAFDGHDLLEKAALIGQDRWPYRAGQRVTMDLSRDGRRFQVEVTLIAGADHVEPLLSLFTTADGEWVAWTPQGYYDASLGGDRLIGWHINQGPDKAAKFYLAQQFRKQFYRPDVLDKVLETGDVPRAIALANAARVHPSESLDLRNPDDLRRMEPPIVRILAPAPGTRTRSAEITVRAEVRAQNDLPIREVTILVNGRPASAKNIERVPGSVERQEMVVERRVELLPGPNKIAVVANNAASDSEPATVSVFHEDDTPAALPNLYILAVGISKYAQEDLDLQFANRDAEDFAAAWKAQEGAVYARVVTRVLTDEKATVRDILDGMEWLVRNATRKDVAILFLSAHGVRDERENYYLATHEIDLKSLRSTAVRWNEVESLIQDIPGKFLLFVDTCHSAGITGAKALATGDPLRELVSEDTGAIVLSSSMAREVSLEDPRWGHGAFTKALLDIFEGGSAGDYNKDGYLSLTELNDNLAERVKELTEGRQHTATKWPPTITNFNFYRLATAR